MFESFPAIWKIRLLNNIVGIRWDDDAETDGSLNTCKELKECITALEPKNDQNMEEIRQCLNNAGSFYLFKEKVEDGGEVLKYSLKLSDDHGIVLNENVEFFGIPLLCR